MKLLGISGTLMGTKTLTLVSGVVDRAARLNPALQTEVMDLRNYALELCDGRDRAHYNESTQQAIEKIIAADCYVIGTPIFQASLSGALKNLFDLLPATAFRGKVVGFVGTGGTYQHFLVIENQLKPIAGYFKAYTAPDYVYAHRDHFNGQNEISDLDVLKRMDSLAAQIVHMSGALTSVSQGV
ncbi:NADPH-dependent oxidoreductase [Paenibacillus oralis]|uniref:NADPH-dependent oxidoreductase n=1 Tax=Paenibacillus oralis TaxID=2490856 RepID=A0A3P3UA92_9BACL|nr:NAD(P)H-dependent oxidoreductase [Paenibacillus oralis]RRJ67275.1 NADPH-dependent oxidoreductase [Paenibacillus oralis]